MTIYRFLVTIDSKEVFTEEIIGERIAPFVPEGDRIKVQTITIEHSTKQAGLL